MENRKGTREKSRLLNSTIRSQDLRFLSSSKMRANLFLLAVSNPCIGFYFDKLRDINLCGVPDFDMNGFL